MDGRNGEGRLEKGQIRQGDRRSNLSKQVEEDALQRHAGLQEYLAQNLTEFLVHD